MFTYFACNFLILYIVIYKQVCYNKTIINKGVFNIQVSNQYLLLVQVTNRVKLLLSTNIRCCPKCNATFFDNDFKLRVIPIFLILLF